MSERKVIGRVDSVIEAQALQSILESNGIDCLIDNPTMGNLMPHMTQAFGGVTLSVWERDEAAAKEIFEHSQAETNEEIPESDEDALEHKTQEFDRVMKRAVTGAIVGSFLLPVIANLFSFQSLVTAHRLDPVRFRARKKSVALVCIFNLTAIGLSIMTAYIVFGRP
jgi:hypothetical protein